MPQRADITIIGAGVVGLAIAANIADERREVYVLEKNGTFGQEASSRNSGVIHAGIYYPTGSLKAEMCVSGNRSLYEFCETYGIGYRKLGKLIVAVNEEEVKELQALFIQGQNNNAEGLKLLSESELKAMEPNVSGIAAIFSPSTGIIDAHALMQCFLARAVESGVHIAYQSEVIGVEKLTDGYKVTVTDRTGHFSFATKLLINCAGLGSDKIAELAGIDVDSAGYRLHYCKGEYFSVNTAKNRLVRRLVYSVPPPQLTSLGIHVTLDLEGRVRLGPSAYYVDRIDYAIDNRYKEFFYNSARKLLPSLEYNNLEPEMAGVRPKLQGPGEDYRDFIIKEESEKGLPGFINLIGIDSPGLTASPAIAEYTGNLVKAQLSS